MTPQVNPIQARDRAVTAFSTCTLLNLYTEVLIEILSYLGVADIWSVQRTCHTLRDIVAGTAYLQYILRTRINGVHDSLPPNCPYSDRLELLRRHEQSWAGLQLNLLTTCVTSMPYPDRFTLQDSYMIYQSLMGGTPRYGYTDLSSTAQNEEACWVHITIDNGLVIHPSKVIFAVDHDLVVVISEQLDIVDAVRVQLAFLEFTTGKPHPLSSTHTVSLPPLYGLRSTYPSAEVLGDHILVLARSPGPHITFYLVSWKTGTVTFVPEASRVTSQTTAQRAGVFKPLVIDDSVFTVTVDSMNRLEVRKLEINPPGPCLQTVCFLEFPRLASGVTVFLNEVLTEWVPTSKDYARWSFPERRVPFYSSSIGTIALLLDYRKKWGRERFHDPTRRTVVVSVEGLLSAIRTGAHNVPWVDWGPSSTHIYQQRDQLVYQQRTPLRPAGPFWITDLSPLVVRQFGLPHMRAAQSIADYTLQNEWELLYVAIASFSDFRDGSFQTNLPYRDIMANDLNFSRFRHIVANREWVVGTAQTSENETSITVYHVG